MHQGNYITSPTPSPLTHIVIWPKIEPQFQPNLVPTYRKLTPDDQEVIDIARFVKCAPPAFPPTLPSSESDHDQLESLSPATRPLSREAEAASTLQALAASAGIANTTTMSTPHEPTTPPSRSTTRVLRTHSTSGLRSSTRSSRRIGEPLPAEEAQQSQGSHKPSTNKSQTSTRSARQTGDPIPTKEAQSSTPDSQGHPSPRITSTKSQSSQQGPDDVHTSRASHQAVVGQGTLTRHMSTRRLTASSSSRTATQLDVVEAAQEERAHQGMDAQPLVTPQSSSWPTVNKLPGSGSMPSTTQRQAVKLNNTTNPSGDHPQPISSPMAVRTTNEGAQQRQNAAREAQQTVNMIRRTSQFK